MEVIKQNKYKLIKFLKKVLARLLIILFCIMVVTNQSKGCPDSKGTDFWLMFNGNIGGSPTISLYITSDVNTSGTVSGPFPPIPFTVAANTFTTVSLPSSVSEHTTDVVQNNGVHVTSTHEVTVYGSNNTPSRSGAYLGLPTDFLGVSYLVLTYKNSYMSTGVQFGIVGTMNNTSVTITPSVTTGSHYEGVPYMVILNQGETYELVNTFPNADLTGTTIISTNPIGVFGSHKSAEIPSNPHDYICEMLPPVNLWGKNFLTVPLKNRTEGDTWRILASENGTTVSINSLTQPPINASEFIETIITSQSIIVADKPVLVAQYSRRSVHYGGIPFMMLVPPIEQYGTGYTMTTSPNSSGYINIVVPTSIVGSPTLILDQAAIPVTAFSPIGTSGYSGAQLDLSSGAHTIIAPVPFGCLVYGFDPNSNGCPAGFGGNIAVSSFTMKDTVCQNESIEINGSPSMNDTEYGISIQELGGTAQDITEWFTGQAGVLDMKSWYISKGGIFECEKSYRVKLGVKNDCTTLSELSKLLYVKCCDSCVGSITAPPSIFYTLGNYPIIPKISVSNFPGTGVYSWELISDSPAQCPGATGTINGSSPFNITLNQRITVNCIYTLKISRGNCTAQTNVTLIPCPCE